MFWIVIIIGILLDQFSKYWIAGHFVLGESLPVIPNVFHLTYILNKGAAFSILSGKVWLLIIVSLVALGGILWYYRETDPSEKLKIFSLACITGGAIGNLIDRICLGAVRDFLDFLIWPIFNIADCFVVVGVVFLLCCLVKEIYQEEKNEKQ